MRHNPENWCLFIALLIVTCSSCKEPISEDKELVAQLPETVDFNYHIRPILSDRCYACHGPDPNTREAEFRIDTEEGARSRLHESARKRAIVPGNLKRSEVAHRIMSDDSEYMMPPPESNLVLSEYETALIRKWIDQGAEWKEHWAFIPPVKSVPPSVSDPSWPSNPIDHFVMARLDREGLTPSPEAEKERLLRRVTFDLTGLPPTIEELDAFLTDKSVNAYEKVVDRLLDTPAYAERMAVDWMDLARYADSHGYHADGYRMMWPWRDWVIKAFDENMPYDQFVTLQLAGDLIPDATQETRLATAFHRNHQMTAEGGIVDEEYRLEYVADRTNTTAMAFMGLTMECARCHDHKFDPVSQAEYFQLSAFFNNVNEVGMTGDDGNAGPMLLLYEGDTEEAIHAVRDSIQALESALSKRFEELAALPVRTVSERTVSERTGDIDLEDGLVDHYPLDELLSKAEEVTTPNARRGREAAGVSGDIELVESPTKKGMKFDYDYDFLGLNNAGLFERYEPFSVALWVYPEKTEDYASLFGNADHKNSYWRGYEAFLDSLNRVNVRLIHALPHNQVHVRSSVGIPLDKWNHITISYDGSSKAGNVGIYLNGERAEKEILFDNLYKSMLPVNGRYESIERPLRIGKSYRSFSGDNGIFTGRVDDIRIYNKTLSALEVAILSGRHLARSDEGRLKSMHDWEQNDPQVAQLRERLFALRQQENALIGPVEEVMVMEEMEPPRETYVLHRGLYDQPKEKVQVGTPEAVGLFSDEFPSNRLGLSKWLMAAENPLTSRVTVNRFWRMYFGTGIVSTPADFGYQGALPTHPALLDWLAVSFIETGWDIKAMQRLIVTSSTYKQASTPRIELEERDPENALLARGARSRLTAEMIRDNALAASGLLVAKVGGPSVKPYQPDGLWIEKGTFSPALLTYEQDRGDGLYRRSLYTFVKRTSPPPSMLAFDATDRSICTVERQATSTPLQSLILMNDPQYVEASRVLAERMFKEGGETLEEKITLGFRLVTSRYPAERELGLFAALYEREYQRFSEKPNQASALLAVGDWLADPNLDPARIAALAMVANTMLNHDGAYMKR